MKKILLVFLAISCSLLSQAQTLFTATADKYQVGVGSTFTVTFEINASGSNFKYPDFNGFSVASGPMTSRSQQFINGESSSSTAASFKLVALKEGTYKIGAASVKAGGKVYQTKPLTIKVVATENAKPNSAEAKAAEMAYVKVLTNKRKVFVGEPISAKYALVLRTNVGQFEYLQQPEFTGFIKNDIPIKNIQTRQEVIDGQRSSVADIQKFVLIPQSAGTFKPGKLQLRLPTGVPTGRRDWFGRAETQTINQVTNNTFPTIEVMPLPKAGQPTNFAGAVGEFDFFVDVSRNEVKGGESITLTVKISGKGNLQTVDLPAPEIPNSIEQYDPKFKENIDVLPTTIRGHKTNEYLLIPQYKGEYKIPAMSFSFFDPVLEKYITKTSEEIIITVTEGEELQVSNTGRNSAPTAPGKNAVEAIGNDILFIHTTPSTFEKPSTSFFATALHRILIFGLLGVIILLFVANKIRQNYRPDLAEKARKKAGSDAKKQLKKAQEKLNQNDVNGFYQEITFALQQFFVSKINLQPADFTQENVAEIIRKNNGPETLIKNIKHLLNQANMARFAPISQANMEKDIALAAQILEELDPIL